MSFFNKIFGQKENESQPGGKTAKKIYFTAFTMRSEARNSGMRRFQRIFNLW